MCPENRGNSTRDTPSMFTSCPNCSRCGTATNSSAPPLEPRKETSARNGQPPADTINTDGVNHQPLPDGQPSGVIAQAHSNVLLRLISNVSWSVDGRRVFG